jgi:hypothetical protein
MKYIITLLLLLTINFSYAKKPPYILYVYGAPGVCQYWFYDSDGTIIPLLKHQVTNNQYMVYEVVQTVYARYKR